MKVKDMMHKGVECVSPDTAINAVAKKMRELDVGAIPVASNGKLVGMVTDRDITIRCVAGNEAMSKVKAKDVMTLRRRLLPRQRGRRGCRPHHGRKADPQAARARRGDADGRHGEPRRRLARAAARHHRRGDEGRLSPSSLTCRGQAAACSSSGFHCAERGEPVHARAVSEGGLRRRQRSRACPTRPFAAPPAARGYRRS